MGKAFESADEEMKDEEEEDCFDVDCGQYVTPGNVEGATLQFSGLDLNKGMIEIQNCGENEIDLNGYCLSNAQGTAQYELPKNMKLERLGKLRIYVGKTMYDQMKSGELDREEIVGREMIKTVPGYTIRSRVRWRLWRSHPKWWILNRQRMDAVLCDVLHRWVRRNIFHWRRLTEGWQTTSCCPQCCRLIADICSGTDNNCHDTVSSKKKILKNPAITV